MERITPPRMDRMGPIELTRRELLAERPAGETEAIHFPEALAAVVIEAYSRPGDVVLDPFAGYGTTAVVAARLGRRPIAIELLPGRAARIRRRLGAAGTVITGDARSLATLVEGPIDLCLTSPPYMTSTSHPENPLTAYRTLDGDYQIYLGELEAIAATIAGLLRPGGHLALNVATITAGGRVTPLAADVGERVGRHLTLVADVPIHWDVAPEGLIDDRCLVFRNPAEPSP
jgi:DNA modification methylase